MSAARGSRGTSTGQSEELVEDDGVFGVDVFDDVELGDVESDEPPVSDLVDVVLVDESDDDPPFEESEVDPGGVVAFEPRLSVLKNPDPLNVTPTGWNTFFTGSTSPDSGWAYSVSVSSVNACWTSMVSPVSTNL